MDWVTVLGFFNFLQKHYPFIVCCGIMIAHPHWKFVLYSFVVLLLCQFLLNVNQQWKSLLQFMLMQHDFPERLSSAEDGTELLKQYRFSEYFHPDQMQSITQTYTNPYLKLFHEHVDEAVCIVDMSAAGMMPGMVCYSRPMFASFLFVNQPPSQNIKPFKKLFVAHEIGHSILSPLFLSSKRTGGILLVGLLLYLICKFVDIQAMPVILIVFYLLVFILVVIRWIFAWLRTTLKDEVYADLAALCLLSDSDRKILEEKMALPNFRIRFFNNSKMIRPFIDRRTQIFLQNLQLANAGRIDLMHENVLNQVEAPLWQRALNILFWCLFYLSFGLFSKSNFLLSLYGLSWFTAATLLVLIGLFFLNKSVDNNYLKRIR